MTGGTLAFSGDDFSYRYETDSHIMKIFSNNEQCKALEDSIVFLTNEIKKNNNCIYLRKLRSQLSFTYSDFFTAKNDIEIVIHADKNDIESLMKFCIIMEAQGSNYEDIHSCYIDVVSVYKEKIKNGILQKNRDYIYSLLMADMPEATIEKEKYLAILGNSLFDEEERKFFTNFDRTKAIPQYPLCPRSPQRK